MAVTNFPDGLASFGITLPSSNAGPNNGKTHWFVHGNLGNNGFDGRSWNTPYRTMAKAFQVVGSGDTIHLLGNIREQLVTPVGVFDVSIIGEGTRPRHADAHTGNNGYTATSTWKSPASPVSGQALLRIQQQGWVVDNILFAGFTTGTPASIEIVRNAASGDDERDGSHATITRCRFAGGSKGVRFGQTSYTENVFDCLIEGNEFSDCVIGIGGATCYRLLLAGNRFLANTNHVVLACTESTIWGNDFQKHTTDSINLTGGGGSNIITKNYLSGTYTIGGGYTTSGASDEWAGNFNTLSGGITVADPAA